MPIHAHAAPHTIARRWRHKCEPGCMSCAARNELTSTSNELSCDAPGCGASCHDAEAWSPPLQAAACLFVAERAVVNRKYMAASTIR